MSSYKLIIVLSTSSLLCTSPIWLRVDSCCVHVVSESIGPRCQTPWHRPSSHLHTGVLALQPLLPWTYLAHISVHFDSWMRTRRREMRKLVSRRIPCIYLNWRLRICQVWCRRLSGRTERDRASFSPFCAWRWVAPSRPGILISLNVWEFEPDQANSLRSSASEHS